jgi:hypothetical protein
LFLLLALVLVFVMSVQRLIMHIFSFSFHQVPCFFHESVCVYVSLFRQLINFLLFFLLYLFFM